MGTKQNSCSRINRSVNDHITFISKKKKMYIIVELTVVIQHMSSAGLLDVWTVGMATVFLFQIFPCVVHRAGFNFLFWTSFRFSVFASC
jgi:hypothetical protein